jgi:hypothetical protein
VLLVTPRTLLRWHQALVRRKWRQPAARRGRVGCVNSVPAPKSVGRERLTRPFSPEPRASTVRFAQARSLPDARSLSLSIRARSARLEEFQESADGGCCGTQARARLGGACGVGHALRRSRASL